MDKVSYALGMGIGQQLTDMGAKQLNIDDFAQAIKDVLAGKTPALTAAEANQTVQTFFAEQEKKQRAAAAERFKTQKESGEKYLAENGKKEGVITLPSGLQYQVLKEGNGRKPKATDQVKCHYEGMLVDGTLFDRLVAARRARHLPAERRDCRLDRRTAGDAGRRQVSLLHTLPPRLWRAWSRTVYTSLRCTHLRRGGSLK